MNESPHPAHRTTPASQHAPTEWFEATLEDEKGIDLAQYWRTVCRHKWGIFSITLMVMIIGALAALSATPIYQAKTVLLVDPILPNAATQTNYFNTVPVHLFYETQYEIIQSRTVSEKVVDKLGLVEKRKQIDEEKTAQAQEPENILQKIKAWKNRMQDMMPDWRQWLPQEMRPESTPKPDDEELRRQLASGIQNKLKVEGGRKSEIINISYDSPDPQQAAEVVNAVADAYIEFGLNSRLNGAKKTASWLNEQLTDLKNNLEASEDELQTYQKVQGLVNSSQQQEIASTQLSTLNAELIRAQTKRTEAQILYNQVKTLKNSRGNYDSLGPVLNSVAVRTLVQEESKFSRRLMELSERYGEKHPTMIAARSDLNEVQRSLQREINKVVDNISKEYKVAAAQERKIATLISNQKREIGSLKGINIELARLEREVENHRRIYENFLSRFQEADVSEEYDASNVRVIDLANVPSSPYKPNKRRIITISTMLGLFLGVLLAFVRESLDNTFKTPDTIEEKLDIPSLGLTSSVQKGRKSSIPEKQFLADSRSQFSENINNIRTGLLFSNIDHPPRVILVTSATESEGKSTLAINLAASLGQLDYTLLLEVDMRRPNIANTLNIRRGPGLSDMVAHQSDLGDFPVPRIGAKNSNLYAITCGTLPPNPLELISSVHFHQVLEKLKNRFKYIVLDAAPILAVSDAVVLGQLADSVIMAIKAESTTVKMTREALGRLKKANVKVTGAVLTQAEPRHMSYYGGHYDHPTYYAYKAPKGEAA